MKSIRPCLSFVGMCLWAMLATREIQGYSYQQPFWNSHNSRIKPATKPTKPMKPASGAMQFPWYYSRLRYPHRFPNASINNMLPYVFDPRLWKGKRPTGSGRWIVPGTGFAGPINFPPMPIIFFPTLFQRTTTWQEQGTSPRNETAMSIEKSEESSTDRGVPSTSEYPAVFQGTTGTLREEPSMTEPIELDHESVSPDCRGDCESDISILIEDALQKGELLHFDEWLNLQNATKNGTHANEREEGDTRKKPVIESAEFDHGPASSCRGNCADNSGSDMSRIVNRTLDNGEPHHGERPGKQNATKGHEEGASKPSEQDVVQESRDPDPVPVCRNSTFCTHLINYPEELVNRAIQQNDSLKLFQTVDPVSEPIGDKPKFDEPNNSPRLFQNADPMFEIGTRLEFDRNDSPFCSSYVRLIYPRSAETMDRRWLYIVNQDNLQQGVRIEVCMNEGSVCNGLDDYLSGGYKVFCKQKYIYRELVAVDNDIVKKDIFRFPSSCCCHRVFVG